MATPWVIVGRFLHVGPSPGGVEAGEDAQAAQHAAAVEAAEEAQAQAEHAAAVEAEEEAEHVAAVEAAEEAQAQAEHSAPVEAAEEVQAQAEQAAAAAEPDFALSVVLPPRVTVLAAGRGAHPDAERPDELPCIITAGPLGLLVHFEGPPYFGTMCTDHLVVVRHLHTAEGLTTASAEHVPGRTGHAPFTPPLWDFGNLVLVSNDKGGYMIVELQVDSVCRDPATLVYLRSGDDAWSVIRTPHPLPSENRKWVPHGAVAIDRTLWWFDLSWGIVSCDAAYLEQPRLLFHPLPDEHARAEATGQQIHSTRCITASRNKLRYTEIIPDGDKSAKVTMWSRSRVQDGWRWTRRYTMSFDDLWRDESYTETELPQNVPVLAVVSPSDPDLVYFTLEQRIFGVDVPAHRVVHSDAYQLVNMSGPRPGSSRFLVAWELPPEISQVVSLEAPTSSQPMQSKSTPLGIQISSSSDARPLVYDVWKETAQDAFKEIATLLHEGKFWIGFDSEFAIPDGVALPRIEPASADLHYDQLCKTVNRGDLIQVGIAVADTNVRVLAVWQFNIHFQTSWRAPQHAGVTFLREQAQMNLERHASHGVPASEFSRLLESSGMTRNTNLTWITFMGYSDFGFLVLLLTGMDTLPRDRMQFLNLFWSLFPQSYDLRVFTKLGRCRREVIRGGLAQVCTSLQVERVGIAHQAGSDALSALLCLERMMMDPDFAEEIPKYCGVLYGLVQMIELID